MRKIGSEAEAERKKKRNVTIMSVFLLLILVFGTIGFGFLFNPNPSSANNNGEELEVGDVINVGNRWAANIQGQIFYFSNSPESVEEITVNTNKTLQSYAGLPLYLDTESDITSLEISSTLGRFTTRIQEACLNSCPDRNVPEKNCSDNLIILQDSSENVIYQEENCIFIEGDLKAVDAFLYDLFNL